MEEYKQKSRTTAFLLCAFFGCLGIHRFYVGKAGTGVLYLLTGGLLTIGAIVDLVRIGLGLFKDSNNQSLSGWTPVGCVIAAIGLIIAIVAVVIGAMAALM